MSRTVWLPQTLKWKFCSTNEVFFVMKSAWHSVQSRSTCKCSHLSFLFSLICFLINSKRLWLYSWRNWNRKILIDPLNSWDFCEKHRKDIVFFFHIWKRESAEFIFPPKCIYKWFLKKIKLKVFLKPLRSLNSLGFERFIFWAKFQLLFERKLGINIFANA